MFENPEVNDCHSGLKLVLTDLQSPLLRTLSYSDGMQGERNLRHAQWFAPLGSMGWHPFSKADITKFDREVPMLTKLFLVV